LTGVWTEGDPPPTLSGNPARKIGSIGLHVSHGVTTHGLAINVSNDLQPFEWIVPCGVEGVRVTSAVRERSDFDVHGMCSEMLVSCYALNFKRVPIT